MRGFCYFEEKPSAANSTNYKVVGIAVGMSLSFMVWVRQPFVCFESDQRFSW